MKPKSNDVYLKWKSFSPNLLKRGTSSYTAYLVCSKTKYLQKVLDHIS